ncbi:MAG: carbamate kinase [Candidatus Zixiibacteriota bacterium]|nr:MAG: carbamate kinase [candidate division Zixibacteria bacterium]
MPKTAVVALGGNAITVPGQEDTIANQFANTRSSLDGIVELVREGYNLVVTHGNGPQVGNALLRIESARGKAPILPLGVLVADTEGGMGYMIEQSLQNRLRAEGIDRPIVTIITQMLVRKDDPAVSNPTKFVGQFYTEEEARIFSETRGWQMRKDADRGWRRVVPSPAPYEAVEADIIGRLVKDGTIVIAGGGGGIPVYVEDNGDLEGMDAVIDKDLASAVIGSQINAEILSILTSVDQVVINFGRSDQTALEECTVTQMKEYQEQGHFPAGSMGPKVQAAVSFLESGGSMVAISNFKDAGKALSGEAGTRIVPD